MTTPVPIPGGSEQMLMQMLMGLGAQFGQRGGQQSPQLAPPIALPGNPAQLMGMGSLGPPPGINPLSDNIRSRIGPLLAGLGGLR